MSTILVPLDGSTTAEQILPYVRLLATTLKARVKLLQVVQEAYPYTYPPPHEALLAGATRGALELGRVGPAAAPASDLRERAEAYLGEQARLQLQGLDVHPLVRFGPPAETIVESAEEQGATLIAMATHGYSGLRRWTLGSTADKVVQASDTPVLVVRAVEEPRDAAPALRRILVPLDGSPLARQALPLACDLARRVQGELLALTVAPMLAWTSPELFTANLGLQEEAEVLHDRLMDELAPFTPGLREQQVRVQPIVTFGVSAATVIIGEAEEREADLIVMASHGYSGLRRWALGSVADKVLHGTTTPLLVVRARAEGQRT